MVLVLGLAAGVLLHLAKQEEAKVAETTETTQVPETEPEISETTEKTRSEQYIKIDPVITPEPSYGKDARPAIDPSGPLPVQPEPSYDWRAPEPTLPRIG